MADFKVLSQDLPDMTLGGGTMYGLMMLQVELNPISD